MELLPKLARLSELRAILPARERGSTSPLSRDSSSRSASGLKWTANAQNAFTVEFILHRFDQFFVVFPYPKQLCPPFWRECGSRCPSRRGRSAARSPRRRPRPPARAAARRATPARGTAWRGGGRPWRGCWPGRTPAAAHRAEGCLAIKTLKQPGTHFSITLLFSYLMATTPQEEVSLVRAAVRLSREGSRRSRESWSREHCIHCSPALQSRVPAGGTAAAGRGRQPSHSTPALPDF